ncbi:amidase [Kaistia dalseonensis]|uniref:Aspartyl-tRNA(Asn)/glutamyl-tRNA(Gln) amidotransferase subunit A n=1 Tax=Kaistia dalseonensis TaxID=410840 RepID=A0ABU0H5L9_9HYPH|nr:amidase [Kaistia dalseonensis]MCX5494486.1 amidase [Kaistia dalseonensis]MDQ0437065.1 aspartyl-tRNA(Asn)/glutamyl-tRNA(Gln) amidotransferase subunit A [Kaistia dalseonensis]
MSAPVVELRPTAVAPSSSFPEAASGLAPEPLWFERRMAAEVAEVRPSPSPAVAVDVTGEPHQLGVAGLLAAYETGNLDPVGVLAALRARIARYRSGLDAILAPIPGADALAEESALRIRERRMRPLEGIPFGVKDIIDAAGARVTCGSLQTGDRVAPADSAVVARLKAAGAIPFVMTATTEFACGSALNARYGPVRNPWDSERWTGGSSTGSGAGLAARLFPLALGTDTGGSIRVPSAWCGTTGLKPTRGLVPRTGVAPLSWTLDHIGPMGRSAADLALVMPQIAGADGEDFTSAGAYDGSRWRNGFAGLRIGVPGGWFVEMQDASVLAAWRAALGVMEEAGATLVPVDLGEIGSVVEDGYTILFCELATLQEPSLGSMELYDAGTRGRLEQGLARSATQYLRALRLRPVVQSRILAAMADVDVVVTPGLGSEAGFLDDLAASVDGKRQPFHNVIPRNTMVFDYTGQPALMLPSGLGANGLPVAIQIVGKLYDDALCLSVGAAFQQLTDHHRNAPPDPID